MGRSLRSGKHSDKIPETVPADELHTRDKRPREVSNQTRTAPDASITRSAGASRGHSDMRKRGRDDEGVDGEDDVKTDDGKGDVKAGDGEDDVKAPSEKSAKRQRIITQSEKSVQKQRIITDPMLESESPRIVVKEGSVEVSQEEAQWFKDLRKTKQSSPAFNDWMKSKLYSGKASLPQGATVGKCSIFAVPKDSMEDIGTVLQECLKKRPSKSIILVIGYGQEKKENLAVVGYPVKNTLYYYKGLEAETAYSIVGMLQGAKGEHPWQLRLAE